MNIYKIGTNGIPAQHGGLETIVDNISVRLAKKGHNVTVYCRRRNIKTKEKYYSGVRLVKLPSFPLNSLETLSHTFFSLLHLLLFERNVDIIHFYGVGNSLFLPFLKLINKRTVIFIDGYDWERKKWNFAIRSYLKLMAKFAALFSDVVIADSRYVKNFYDSTYGVETSYLANGPDIIKQENETILDEFALKKNSYILFVGRLVPEKRIEVLIEAYKKANLNNNIKLAIVGGSWFNNTYEEKIKKSAADNQNIVFLGKVYGEAVLQLYKHAYIFIMTSEVESASLALITAMGNGKCVIVNGIPQNKEVIGEAGFYYKENDSNELAALLKKLVQNPELAQTYGQKAMRRVADHYDWDKTVDQLISIYERILN